MIILHLTRLIFDPHYAAIDPGDAATVPEAAGLDDVPSERLAQVNGWVECVVRVPWIILAQIHHFTSV